MKSHLFWAGSIWLGLLSAPLAAADPTPAAAAAALEKAVAFFDQKVSIEGGYLWRYSDDLKLREGENTATATQAWVQPPGTPTVGEALLAAYERTGEKYLLAAAVRTARAVVKCQLASGGWDYRLEFDPAKRSANAYRADGPPAERARNVSTLDDDTTQAAVRFLMRVDRVLGFQDRPIHEATQFALESLLKAQYPNGAWPQRFSAPPRAEDFPVLKANYPDSWPRTWPNQNYMSFYTLNDDTQADVIETMFDAAEIYSQSKYLDAARRGGDFLILAQMPEPQPAWAQQYNAQMQPAWARKFEPPSITGGESQGAIRILMAIYRQTGDKKYLEPIPRALAYLEKSIRSDGRMPRFLELKTNTPLYFTRQYELVYTDNDLPTHYGFITGNNLARIRAEYERLLATAPDKLKPDRTVPADKLSPALIESAGRAISALDSRGAWAEDGRLRDSDPEGQTKRVISTPTFTRNVETLSRFIAASK
jgi:Pectic acid lyase